MSPEPSRRLPEAAKTYWRMQLLAMAAIPLIVSFALMDAWSDLGVPVALPPAVVVVLALVAAALLPGLRWRRWRFDVRDDEIDLRHGTFTVRRTLVPIRRVQHVDTSSGALQSALDLATVSFHTAAGVTELPALTRADAEAVRVRVGELTRTRDDV